jgi:hypothetical protein
MSNVVAMSLIERTISIKWDNDHVCFVLDKHVELNRYRDRWLKQQYMWKQLGLLGQQYRDSEPTSLWSYSLMLHA